MVKLISSLPRQWFENWPNMKLYPWAMHPALLDTLDKEIFQQIPLKTVWDTFPDCKNITFIRHLESKYNEYKNVVKNEDIYKQFMIETDQKKKYELSLELLKHYRDNVGTDPQTNISEHGKQQGEILWKLYAKLIKQHPEIFPSLIVVSPYLRTRLTANYFLKHIEWLDLDINKIITKENKQDMFLWSFQGKDVILKLSDEIRERDHGKDVAPQYLTEYYALQNPLHTLGSISEDEEDELYYYTAPNGGESQVQVNQRIKQVLYSLMSEKYNNILVVSHHLAVLAAMNNIFAGTINTFQNFDNNWKPANGSMTVFSQLPETESGQKDKLRVSAYNTILTE